MIYAAQGGKSFKQRISMCALTTYKHSPIIITESDPSEFLCDLEKMNVHFLVGGSHAYRDRLSNGYKPQDLDIVVFGEENVALVKETLENAGIAYVMSSVKESFIDMFFRFRRNKIPRMFGCTIKTADLDFNFKQVKNGEAVFWILRYPPLYFAGLVDVCNGQRSWGDGHAMIDWKIGILMVLKDEVRRRYLRKRNVPDRSDKISNLTHQSKKEMINFLDAAIFEGNRLFVLIFKSLMKRILHA